MDLITPKQLGALQSAWKRLREAGDVRVHMGPHEHDANKDDKQLRQIWAFWKLGRRPVCQGEHSWKGITQKEAEYLLDYVNGGKTKLDLGLERECARLDIKNPRTWFEEFTRHNAGRKNCWTFHNRTWDTLNRRDKMDLMTIMSARAPGMDLIHA